MTHHAIILSALLAFATASCAGGDQTGSDKPVPRAHTYPRLQLYGDSSYTTPSGLPVNFEINDSAIVEINRSKGGNIWLSAAYPIYGLDMYVTVATASDGHALEDIVDNRLERIALNTGGNDSEMTEFNSSGGFGVRMFETSGNPVPLQFIAVKNNNGEGSATVVTGSAAFRNAAASANPDSVYPIVDAVRRDLIHALTNLTTISPL